jgi:hypothetical protein
VNAWKAVFRIEARYVNRVGEGSDYWVKEFLNTKAYASQPSVKTLRADFMKAANWLSKPEQLRSVSESALRAAYFEFLANQAIDDQISGLAGTSTSPAITQIPVAVGSTN